MADLYGSRVLVRLNDGTADANNAAILAAAPSAGDYGLAVRQVGIAAAAALADATANPTTTLAGVAQELFNGTTWDRVRSVINAQNTVGTGIAAAGLLGQLDDTATGAVTEDQFAPVRISTRRALLVEGVASGTNMNVNLAASAVTVTVDTELPAAAALADATANPTTPSAGSFLQGYNGTTWDRLRSTTANGLAVDVTRVTGTVTVDTELTAVAAMGDATANPTITTIAGYLMGFNGTTWDRVRTANTGRLQVDIVTGGSSPAASELPTAYNMIDVYATSAALASAGNADVATNTPANTKLVYIRQISASSSGASKVQLLFGAAVKFVAFLTAAVPSGTWRFDPPIPVTGDAVTVLKVNVTNREGAAQDVYARLNAIVQQ